MDTINGLQKPEAVELAFKIGFEGEREKTSCAQESFHAISSVLGIRNSLVFKCLSALEAGGGITTAGSCGAFSGSLVAFSYYFGRTYDQWEEGNSYIKASILGQKLYKKFVNQFDTIICTNIHKKIYGRTFKLMDEDNLGIDRIVLEEFEKMGAHTHMCSTVVGLAAAWTVNILWDEIPKDRSMADIPGTEEALKNFKPTEI